MSTRWGTPPEPTKPTQSKNNKLGCAGMAGAAFFILVAVGVIGAITIHPSSTTSTTVAPAASSDVSPLRVAMTAWWNKHQGTLNAIQNDMGSISTAATSMDIPGVRRACSQLRSDTATAQSLEAVPDAEMAQHLYAGFTHYAQGAKDCVAGVNDSSADEIRRATESMDAGGSEIQLATARLNELSNQ